MFKKCLVQILQPMTGTKLSNDINKDKWLIVSLKREPLYNYLNTEKRIYEWLGQGYTLWGTYTVVDNNPDKGNSSYYIGNSASKEYKIWRYNVKNLNLSFSVINTEGGGGLKYGEISVEVKNEIDLSNAVPSNSGIEPIGNVDYGKGQANVKSWIQPFQQGGLFWTWVSNM
jgi:hypothetical protein